MNNFLKNPIVHGIAMTILFIIPTVIASGGSWQSLTLGGILAAVYRWGENNIATSSS